MRKFRPRVTSAITAAALAAGARSIAAADRVLPVGRTAFSRMLSRCLAGRISSHSSTTETGGHGRADDRVPKYPS